MREVTVGTCLDPGEGGTPGRRCMRATGSWDTCAHGAGLHAGGTDTTATSTHLLGACCMPHRETAAAEAAVGEAAPARGLELSLEEGGQPVVQHREEDGGAVTPRGAGRRGASRSWEGRPGRGRKPPGRGTGAGRCGLEYRAFVEKQVLKAKVGGGLHSRSWEPLEAWHRGTQGQVFISVPPGRVGGLAGWEGASAGEQAMTVARLGLALLLSHVPCPAS